MKLYHGTNTEFKDYDTSKSGGMTHFTDDYASAKHYAEGGGGNRRPLSIDEIDVYDDIGNKLLHDSNKKAFFYPNGEKVSYDMINQPNGSFFSVPKKSWIKSIELDPEKTKLLNLTEDADIKILKDILKPTNNTTRRFLEDINNQLADEPGHVGINHSLWTRTKLSRLNPEEIEDFVNQLKQYGYEGINFRDDGHKTIALFDPNKFNPDRTPKLPSSKPDFLLNKSINVESTKPKIEALNSIKSKYSNLLGNIAEKGSQGSMLANSFIKGQEIGDELYKGNYSDAGLTTADLGTDIASVAGIINPFVIAAKEAIRSTPLNSNYPEELAIENPNSEEFKKRIAKFNALNKLKN
jgi:hypothetical protein